MLEVQSDKAVLDSLGEEQASSIAAQVLLEDVEEEILVELVEEEEREDSETVDDGRDDRVRETDHGHEGHCREERSPCHGAWVELDVVDAAGGAAEQDQLDIVDDKLDDLEEPAGSARKTVQDDICQEERGRLWQVLSQDGRN